MSTVSPLSITRSEPAFGGVRRVALEAIDQAIARLEREGGAEEKDIHEARKRLKELRALIRLVASSLPDRGRPLRVLARDAGRKLASSRDADALIEAFDKLRESCRSEWGPRRFLKIRRALNARREAVPDSSQAEVLSAMRQARAAVESWTHPGAFNAFAKGLLSTYRRARRDMRDAFSHRTPQHLHEWRKRVKEQWAHTQVLEEAWPAMLRPQAESLHQLSRLLGDHHDLAVLRDTYTSQPGQFASRRLLREFDTYVAERFRDLESEAELLGRRLFEDKPGPWLRRMRAYWRIWRGEESHDGEREGPRAVTSPESHQRVLAKTS